VVCVLFTAIAVWERTARVSSKNGFFYKNVREGALRRPGVWFEALVGPVYEPLNGSGNRKKKPRDSPLEGSRIARIRRLYGGG